MRSSSLQARLFRVQMVTVVAFILGAAVFGWRMTVVDQTIDRQFHLANQLRLLRHASDVADAMSTPVTDDERVVLRNILVEDLRRSGELDARVVVVIAAAERALQDLRGAGARLQALRPEIIALNRELDDRALAAEQAYRREMLWAAASWSLILLLPLVLALWPLRLSRSVIDGIHRLGRKVELGRRAGEPREIVIERGDEIGELGRAIDDTFAALRRREAEAGLARQLEVEQQRLADVVSLTGGIAHEVANPLSVIMANLDCIEMEHSPEIESIREGLQRIQDVLRDVTAFSGSDDGIDLVDVNSVVASAFRIVKLDDRNRGNRFAAELDPGLPAVAFRRPALALAAFSLLSLAAAALRDSRGALEVRTAARDGGVEVVIFGCRQEEPEGRSVGFLDIPDSGEYSTLRSLIRVMRVYGGDLVIGEMSNDARQFELRLPAAPLNGRARHG